MTKPGRIEGLGSAEAASPAISEAATLGATLAHHASAPRTLEQEPSLPPVSSRAAVASRRQGWLQSIGSWFGQSSAADRSALGAIVGSAGPATGVPLSQAKGHDLEADPSGLLGPSGDGGLPATIARLLELRRDGDVSRSDLVAPHEVTAGNKLELLVDGEAAYAEMMKAIDEAEDWINVSFFIFKDDKYGKPFADKLIEKAAQGVKVRVMFDEGGSILGEKRSAPKALARLEKAGIEVLHNTMIQGAQGELFSSPDHRKIVAVDGKVAFTGGVNIGDPYVNLWHDLMVKVEGAAAHQLNAEFLLSWLHRGGSLDPELDDAELRARYFPEVAPVEGGARVKVAQSIPGESNEIARAYVQLIDAAETSIDVISPYVTSAEVQAALRRAAERGVKVRLIVPEENNHFFCDLAARSCFPELLAAGVEIYDYPGMVHAKVMVIDGQRTVIGTSNLDDISLRRAYEVNLNVDDAEFAASVTGVFEKDIASSKNVDDEAITAAQRMIGGFWYSMFSGYL